MQKFKVSLLCLLFIFQFTQTNSQVSITKIPGWVTKQEFDKNFELKDNESSFVYLLINDQENYSRQQQFGEYAYRVLNTEGIQSMSDLYISFDPAYEKIEIHFIKIIRGNEEINQMPVKFNILQRETNAERYLYDGSKTILVNLNDVRVGDIVHYSYSRKGYNPIFSNHFARNYNLQYGYPIVKLYNQVIIPKNLSIYWKNENTNLKPENKSNDKEISFSWTLNNLEPIIFDNNEPEWFDLTPRLILSTFTNWNAVKEWALPYYKLSEAEIESIRKLIEPEVKKYSTDGFINWSINFVQDQIRYLGFEGGLNGYKPHKPEKIYQQRFGDCKDKSLLLTAILQSKGIEAFPVLVNTRLRKELNKKQPSYYAFDHCIVGFKFENEIHFIDPTINNQGGNWYERFLPKYGYGLAISKSSLGLQEIKDKNNGKIIETHEIEIAGLNGEAMMSVKTTYTGNEADNQRSYFEANSKEKILKNYLAYYGNLYPDISKFDELTWTDNREKNIFTVNEKYKISTFWKVKEGKDSVIYCEFYPLTLESYFNINKTNNKKTPYRITYPVDYEHTIRVTLHDTWNIIPSSVNIENELYQYQYDVAYDNAYTLTLRTNYKTLTDEIPVEKLSTFIEDHSKMMDNLSYTLQFNQTVQNSIDNNISGIVVMLLTFLLGLAGIYFLYTRYDPTPKLIIDYAKQEPIGGWLFLVGFGVIVTPIRLIYQFYTEPEILNGKIWYSQFLAGENALGLLVLSEQIYNILYFLLSCLLLLLFLQRRSSFPFLMIIKLATHALFVNINNALAVLLNPETTWDTSHCVQVIIQALVWIPYMIYSERVKETFLTRYKNES